MKTEEKLQKTTLVKLVLQHLSNNTTTADDIRTKFNNIKSLFSFNVDLIDVFVDNDTCNFTIKIGEEESFFRVLSLDFK